MHFCVIGSFCTCVFVVPLFYFDEDKNKYEIILSLFCLLVKWKVITVCMMTNT